MKIVPLLLALALPAHAAVVGVAEGEGAHIALHNEPGSVCVGRAMMAEHVPDKGERVGGCWTTDGNIVYVVFFDGDVARFLRQAITPPKKT